jgi:hypothetical protein
VLFFIVATSYSLKVTQVTLTYCDVLPESQNVGAGVAKHVPPATFGPADKNRIVPVSIQRKPLYNNRGYVIAIQRICWKRFRHDVTLTVPVLNTVGQEAI